MVVVMMMMMMLYLRSSRVNGAKQTLDHFENIDDVLGPQPAANVKHFE